MEHVVYITDRATTLAPPLDSGGKWVMSSPICLRKPKEDVYCKVIIYSLDLVWRHT